MGPPSSEGTEAICRVPSGDFSQAPWYTLPAHLCRFRVRSIRRGYFLEPLRSQSNPIRTDNTRDPSHTSRFRNINLIPIDYPLRARLRGRLTLRGLTLRRNPWAFGDRASHPVYRYSCQHSHFRYLHRPLPDGFISLRNAPLPRAQKCTPEASVHVFSPVTFSPQDLLFRPVSCYAFFKGWLLLSQPPGCHSNSTSFST